MRHSLLASFLFASLLFTFTRAALADADDQKFFDNNIGKLVTLQITPITSPAIPKVSDGRFFSINVVVNGGWTTLTVARINDTVAQVTIPSTDGDMPDLKTILKPALTLKSDDDAHTLQDALDTIYPVTDANDIPAKTIRHAGTTWTFVRGKFFDHFKAIVITTDDNGTITSIKWSLNS
jgi:hypothetical protein